MHAPTGEPTENQRLKVGYQVTLQRLAAFEPDPGVLDSEEEGYFWALDQEYMRIPLEFAFETLQSKIPEDHHRRIELIWRKVLEQRALYETSRKTLQAHWGRAPEVEDAQAEKAVATSPLPIEERFRKSTKALVAKSQLEGLTTHPAIIDYDRTGTVDEITGWQTAEKALRRLFYESQKNYITALRCYYEMLLETGIVDTQRQGVIPLDDPERMGIVVRNRYARVIDACHQAVTMAKAAHHEQGRNRLRKVGNIPYVNHVIDVVRAYIYDVVGAEIGDLHMSNLHMIVGVVSAALHDVLEDTRLTAEDLLKMIDRFADRYDTRIDQDISSGFGESRKTLKDRSINLLSPDIVDQIFQVLNILNKDHMCLTEEEMKGAIRTSITSTGEIRSLLKYTSKGAPQEKDVEDTDLQRWGFKPTKTSMFGSKIPYQTSAQSKTFRTYPTSYDPSMDGFLIKVNAAKDPTVRDIALLLKMEDRANNLGTAHALAHPNRMKIVRATSTRLLPYIMLDNTRSLRRKPFARVVRRLIEATIVAYERIESEHWEWMNPDDHEYLSAIRGWRDQIPKNTETLAEPERMTNLLTPYRVAKVAA